VTERKPELKITGWKAVVVLLMIFAFAVYRFQAARAALPTDGADEIKLWLTSEYISAGLPALERAVEANDSAAVADMSNEILSRDRVTFRTISARGAFDDLVVKVDVRVDGVAPPVGDRVRYFRMHFSTVTGWIMDYETTAVAYWLNIF
jgi:hypothetical protein